jgi:hypothetical protein
VKARVVAAEAMKARREKVMTGTPDDVRPMPALRDDAMTLQFEVLLYRIAETLVA